ncbi:MAG TPA: hypothetical protein VF753_14825 [Terriglobales bacterium]
MRGKTQYIHYAVLTAAAAFAACCFLSVSVAQAADSAARDSWRAALDQSQPGEGCFTATYPSTQWQAVECKDLHPRVHPRIRRSAVGQVTGNGHDYVAQSSGLTQKAMGSFPTATGITSEKSVGVAQFGGGGILGPNEYSLQLNTNFGSATAACNGSTTGDCIVWEQFIYATDYETEGEAAVFIQNWLINWGDTSCPKGFASDGEGDCYGNSKAVSAPDVSPKSLANVTLKGAVAGGGSDTVTFTNGTTAYAVSEPDTTLDISQVWQQSEFNVVGDAGGSRAQFNKGVTLSVKVALTDGSTSAPACVSNEGTTGESNNLNLGACGTAGGSMPYIKFNESN